MRAVLALLGYVTLCALCEACVDKNTFLVVHSTHGIRHGLVEASATTWRAGIPTFVVSDTLGNASEVEIQPPYNAINETWWHYPPANEFPTQSFEVRSFAALRIAVEHSPARFDWVLYGDDDTMWLPDSVSEMLCGENPTSQHQIRSNAKTLPRPFAPRPP